MSGTTTPPLAETRPRRPAPSGPILLALAPVVIVTHHLAVLPHEVGHSLVAWLCGIKATPFGLHWGGATWLNALTLHRIDENVDYRAAFAAGRTWAVALTAFTGPFLVNGGLYLAARATLARLRPDAWLAALATYWFLVMNLGNVFDYVPVRTFAASGDVAHLCRALGLAPWLVALLGAPLVLAALVDLYRVQVPRLGTRYGYCRLARRAILVLSTLLMFGFFGAAGFRADDPISAFIAWASLTALPLVLLLAWRTDRRVETSDIRVVEAVP